MKRITFLKNAAGLSAISVLNPFSILGTNNNLAGKQGIIRVKGQQTTFIDEQLSLIPGNKQLFLDDYIVQKMEGLSRTLHQPVKKGPVMKPDLATEGYVWWRSPIWIPEEGVYRMYYNNEQFGMLATSKDGIHWERPNLGLVEFRGSTNNNHLPDSCPSHVAYDPGDPDPNRRYKALFAPSWDKRVPATSPDGLHWTRFDVPAIPSSDTSGMCFDPYHQRWIATLKTTGKYGRSANISISTDFEHWSAPRFFFGTDDEDQALGQENIRRRLADPGLARPLFVDPDPALGWQPPTWRNKLTPQAQAAWQTECYMMSLFPYEGVYVALLMIYHATGTGLPEKNNTDGFHLIQLAMTRDLETPLTRLGNRETFIGPSRIDQHGLVGNYDRMQLGVTDTPIERGDELWFYYSGTKCRVPMHDRWMDGNLRDPSTLSAVERADWLEDAPSALCLAVLRRDGFISLDAGQQDGYVLTKPMKLTGSRLLLNLDATKGHARVEILDEQGRPINGFSGEQAAQITGDGTRLPVTWHRNRAIDKLAGQTVHFKIHLRNAKLYAFWTE